MKQTLKFIIVFALVLILLLGLCSCKKEDVLQKPIALAIVVGNHANAQLPSVSVQDTMIRSILEKIGNNQDLDAPSVLAVFRVDGNPCRVNPLEANAKDWNIYIAPYPTRTNRTQKEGWMKEMIEPQITSWAAYIGNDDATNDITRAQTEEVDTLGAIYQAAQWLRTQSGCDKYLFVYDSGLATTGHLNFLDHNTLYSPQAKIDALKRGGFLPRLQDVQVHWYGFGAVAEPQDKLKDLLADNNLDGVIESIWESVLTESGARLDNWIQSFSAGNTAPSANYPKVSVLRYSAVLPEAKLEFIGDQATFVNLANAKNALLSVADYIKKNPNFKGLIVGTTARRGIGDGVSLSLKRAEAVKTLLIEMGVSSAQLQTVGLGSHHRWYKDDMNSEEMARENRRIYLLDIESGDAKAILEGRFGEGT